MIEQVQGSNRKGKLQYKMESNQQVFMDQTCWQGSKIANDYLRSFEDDGITGPKKTSEHLAKEDRYSIRSCCGGSV